MSCVPFVHVPDSPHYWLTNGRIPKALLASTDQLTALPQFLDDQQEELVAADIEIRDGRISAIVTAGEAPDSGLRCDLGQGLVWPCFVDMHTHLDKAHAWPRTPNPLGTFAEALKQANRDRQAYWRPADLKRRMDFALGCSYAHGTRAVRTHLDCLEDQAETSFAVIDELRSQWAGKIDIQFVSLVPIEFFLEDRAPALAQLLAKYGGILGAVTYAHPQLEAQVERLFQLASDYDLAVDLHVDESLDPEDQALGAIAQIKLRQGFENSVVCGHVCSLSVQSESIVKTTLEQIKAADISIVSLPMCNLYLQDRHPGRMPRYRGVTLLHELQHQGIPVALASDNCRDAFYAYGDHDGLEVFTQSVRIGHLDRPYGSWPQAVTVTPAQIMGLAESGRLGVGASADLVLFKARSLNELISRTQGDRAVLRQGQGINTTPPDYAELDDLMGWA
ncbi:cytosine deaminase [filamentous cyanobacterium CCP5]|nr:cytosine deaminase [filamentous cyanobacterium CCP5]